MSFLSQVSFFSFFLMFLLNITFIQAKDLPPTKSEQSKFVNFKSENPDLSSSELSEDPHNFYQFTENRAKIASMGLWLLTPEQEWIWVDMDMTCGSQWAHAALMIKSQDGAELVAAGLAAKYGTKAGEELLKKWTTKTNPEDPRLPTYVVVYNQLSENKGFDTGMPKIKSACGGVIHQKY